MLVTPVPALVVLPIRDPLQVRRGLFSYYGYGLIAAFIYKHLLRVLDSYAWLHAQRDDVKLRVIGFRGSSIMRRLLERLMKRFPTPASLPAAKGILLPPCSVHDRP
jgi:hypothetical protein